MRNKDEPSANHAELPIPSAQRREAIALGKVGAEAYEFLCKKLGIAPPFELVILSKADWKKAFGSQAYGDPVTPGDGRVYYGRGVPDSWTEVVSRVTALRKGLTSNILSPAFFRRTLAHEIGHLFSNELMGANVRSKMDEDFSSGNLEVLWFVETFSQCCQLAYLEETSDPYKTQWLLLYRQISDAFESLVQSRRPIDWGTHVVRSMRTDLENARLSYMWMQAKSYLLCEALRKEADCDVLIALAEVVKEMGYPVTNEKVVREIVERVHAFQDVFRRWNTESST